MDRTESRARLREILAGERCVGAASVFDPMSARIATELGIDVGLMGGSLASLAVLGAPDLTLITLTELAEQTRRACRAGKLALIVDADHGYGNALNVARTVEELEAAGAAACTIEDTLLPRAHGAASAAQLLSVEEGAGKMRAAVRARGDSGMLVFGRTSAHAIAGVDQAIARFRAYERTGVDALFIPGVKKREDLERLSAATTLPLVLGGAGEKLVDPPLSRGPQGARLHDRTRRLHGHGAGPVRHDEGGPRWRLAQRAARHRARLADGEAHARRGVRRRDQGRPRRIARAVR